MMNCKSVVLIKIILFFLFVINTFITTLSQESETIKNENKSYISWIGQYPPLDSLKQKTSIKRKISKILFGKGPLILSKPFSILAKNPDGFWILDQGNGTIIQVDKNIGELPRFIEKKLENFTSLVGICSFLNKRILFTDSHLDKIFLINPDKKKLQILNDSLSLQQPTGIAYSKIRNEIWVVETNAHRVSVLNDKGMLIKQIGKRGIGQAEFNFPTFIWIDKHGNAYIVDSMNFRVQVFDKEGKFVTLFGENGDASGYLARPKGIATDSFGNIYIADAIFHVVQIFDKSGNYLYKFGEQGQGKGQFWMPTGIYIDDKDYIYVSDSYNSRVQIFRLIKTDIK